MTRHECHKLYGLSDGVEMSEGADGNYNFFEETNPGIAITDRLHLMFDCYSSRYKYGRCGKLFLYKFLVVYCSLSRNGKNAPMNRYRNVSVCVEFSSLSTTEKVYYKAKFPDLHSNMMYLLYATSNTT